SDAGIGAVVVVVEVDDVVVELDAAGAPSPSAETALDAPPSEPPAPSAASAASAPTEISTARRTGRARRGIRRWWHSEPSGGRHRRRSSTNWRPAAAWANVLRMADLVIVDKPQPRTSV